MSQRVYNVQVVPLASVLDSSEILWALWQGLNSDGLLDTVFFDGSVQSLLDLVHLVDRSAAFLVVSVDDTLAGAVWLLPGGLVHRSVEIGFFFLRRFWNGIVSYQTAESILGKLFELGIDVIVGRIWEPNMAARRFAARCGFVEQCIVDNVVFVSLDSEGKDDGRWKRRREPIGAEVSYVDGTAAL